ncbi:MAG: hypothetical protein JWN03_6501 [Nocardia sp.]|uniref:hypothetical protein n=1 Tax=Nocardia sp. TaxID=1821 RepID=UPI002616B540|nr:hypothetical protein [Nocardia sp.]MCU1646226.1 hypothetical protein [Nocardia sp.]
MVGLYEYFAAPDDTAAAAAVRCDAASLGLPSIGLVIGIDPALQMARLESLLRGIENGLVIGEPRWCVPVTSLKRGRGPWIVTITDGLCESLAAADDTALAQTVWLWARTQPLSVTELARRENALADFLSDFADLAREARASDRHLYCWMSL